MFVVLYLIAAICLAVHSCTAGLPESIFGASLFFAWIGVAAAGLQDFGLLVGIMMVRALPDERLQDSLREETQAGLSWWRTPVFCLLLVIAELNVLAISAILLTVIKFPLSRKYIVAFRNEIDCRT